MALAGTGKTANIRDDGFHVAVSEEGVKNAIRIFESLGSCPIEYKADDRTFFADGEQIGAFDLWGNLVIYHDTFTFV